MGNKYIVIKNIEKNNVQIQVKKELKTQGF
jgi:hypothetical protein